MESPPDSQAGDPKDQSLQTRLHGHTHQILIYMYHFSLYLEREYQLTLHDVATQEGMGFFRAI